jgi:hypothetical protein
MIAFLCASELIAICALPLLVPDSAYLRLYLGEDSRRSIGRLLGDPESYLVWDVDTGWRNRPNLARGKWQMDEQGSRMTQRARSATNGQRVWFFGDSTINGGLRVGNEETISAYAEDARLTAVNYGTMLFGLDQAYLQMRSLLERSAPAAVVVGISENSLGALGNRFVPFRRRSEVNMPFLKPRFVLIDSSIELLGAPPKDAYLDLLGPARLLSELAATDEYFGEFAGFRRFGLSPISGSLRQAYGRLVGYWEIVRGTPLAGPLLTPLMRALDRDARARGVVLVFVALPDQAGTVPSRLQRLLPDRYGELLWALSDTGLEVVDGRAAFLRSGVDAASLFGTDRVHYTPEGNRLIAQELRRKLAELGVGR